MTFIDYDLWQQSIKEELQVHEQNITWEVVDKPPVECKWVFKI